MEIISLSVGMMPTNCYIAASDEKNAAVIDPGGDPEKILHVLESRGWTARKVFLTHGHFDHVGAVKALQAAGAAAGVSREDEIFLTAPELTYAGMDLPITEDLRIRPDFTFEGGQGLELDELSFRVIATPGHTRGSVCFLCGDVIFSGDTLFREGCGRTDLYGGSWNDMNDSLKKLAGLPGDFRILPGHGAETTLGHERRYNQWMGAADYDFDD